MAGALGSRDASLQFGGQVSQFTLSDLLVIGYSDQFNLWHDQGVDSVVGNDALGIGLGGAQRGIGIELCFETIEAANLGSDFAAQRTLIAGAQFDGSINLGTEVVERVQPPANFAVSAGYNLLYLGLVSRRRTGCRQGAGGYDG